MHLSNIISNSFLCRFGEPRTVILHKGKKGFGFILRGAKATSPLMERQPTEFWPSLQYLDDVDKGGVAEMAGLKKGDFLLEINGQDVSQASHERWWPSSGSPGTWCSAPHCPGNSPPKRLRYLPKETPKRLFSVGRARARSMVAGLAEIEVLDHTLNEYDSEGRSTKSSSVEHSEQTQQQRHSRKHGNDDTHHCYHNPDLEPSNNNHCKNTAFLSPRQRHRTRGLLC
ncbi:SH3 and multiple ankyrin repeat domains protein 1 [Caerostris extrusa]|uniref:SH3 and multiple ankyrin repeat domains protein 1 n=1 Tax=Caerostris extrusa TaxID=172846 RepID=A0AAV4SBW1_CAEEX|nr:SH3 and multiple ankyrin repeat domains protein 1 [Caerostris extrusa]